MGVMNERPENELFSAYLDGELTADEQAEVERVLADSPRARRVLAELRALSATLQSLPQETLGEDLSESVLHAAARRILTGDADDRPTPAGIWPLLKSRLTGRALLWPAIAVSIGIMLMLNDPQGWRLPGDDPVAFAPAEPAAREDAPPPRANRPAPSMQAIEPATEAGKASDAAPAPAAMPTEERLKESEEVMFRDKPLIAKGEGGDRWADPAAESTAKPLAPNPGPPMALKGAGGHGGGGMDELGAAGAGQAVRPFAAGIAPEDATAAGHAEGQAEAGVLVVHSDLDPEALQTQSFGKLLAQNGIAFESRDDGAGNSGLDDPTTILGRLAIRDGADNAHDNIVPLADSLQSPDEAPVSQSDKRKTIEAADLDLVYVEAAPAQIEAVLAQMAAANSQYLSISVEPAPGIESQKKLREYTRREPRGTPDAPKDGAEAPQAMASQRQGEEQKQSQAMTGRARRIGVMQRSEAAGEAIGGQSIVAPSRNSRALELPSQPTLPAPALVPPADGPTPGTLADTIQPQRFSKAGNMPAAPSVAPAEPTDSPIPAPPPPASPSYGATQTFGAAADDGLGQRGAAQPGMAPTQMNHSNSDFAGGAQFAPSLPIIAPTGNGEAPVYRVLFVLRAAPHPLARSATMAAPAADSAEPAPVSSPPSGNPSDAGAERAPASH
jgi:hypothetical protein